MARLDNTFRAADAPPSEGFDLLPAGQYAAQIIESGIVDAKSGRGQMITLTWAITDGPAEGRRVWQRINHYHENPQAMAIGQRDLRQILDALGLESIDDTAELEFKPMRVKVGIEVDKSGQYGDRNAIKGVAALYPVTAPNVAPQAAQRQVAQQRPPAAQQQATQQQAPASRPAAPGRRPWEGRA